MVYPETVVRVLLDAIVLKHPLSTSDPLWWMRAYRDAESPRFRTSRTTLLDCFLSVVRDICWDVFDRSGTKRFVEEGRGGIVKRIAVESSDKIPKHAFFWDKSQGRSPSEVSNQH